jgi:gamma-butyrobetaine dioxygenase
VAEHFGSVHVNNYGRVFDVRTGTDLTLGSNTGKYLGPHTDESYRHGAPGITLFHCLAASLDDGGETILVDGFKAAEVLKESDPASFDILCRVPVFFQRRALPEEDMQSHRRIIALDIDGDVEGIQGDNSPMGLHIFFG